MTKRSIVIVAIILFCTFGLLAQTSQPLPQRPTQNFIPYPQPIQNFIPYPQPTQNFTPYQLPTQNFVQYLQITPGFLPQSADTQEVQEKILRDIEILEAIEDPQPGVKNSISEIRNRNESLQKFEMGILNYSRIIEEIDSLRVVQRMFQERMSRIRSLQETQSTIREEIERKKDSSQSSAPEIQALENLIVSLQEKEKKEWNLVDEIVELIRKAFILDISFVVTIDDKERYACGSKLNNSIIITIGNREHLCNLLDNS